MRDRFDGLFFLSFHCSKNLSNLGAICKPLSGQLCGLCRRMGSDPLNGGKMAPLSGLPCHIGYTKAFLSLNGFADAHFGSSNRRGTFVGNDCWFSVNGYKSHF